MKLVLSAILLAAAASAAEPEQDWSSVHGTPTNQRYVALDQINRGTVKQLGAVWVSEPFADGATSRMTPLVHDGVMFLAAGPRIYALDARTGKPRWVHVTETRKPPGARGGLGFDFASMVSGLAITRSFGLGLGGGMIFTGMMSGHVVALDEKTGDLVWDKLISTDPLAVSKGIVCPPLYADGVLYFGLGQETSEGHAVAIDAKTGAVLWRTPMVAEPGQKGHETWPAGSEIWRSGAAHPWAAAAADPALGLVYFVTGNAGPGPAGRLRPGDNLYSVSLVALDMKTGAIRWHRQLIHHDLWEADLSVPPVLFDREIGGRKRQAIAAIRGDGYVFLFDRATGEPLIPIDERPVPQNEALATAATQPYPRGGDTILPLCDSWKSKIPDGFIPGCMFDPPSHDVPNRLSQWASVRIAPMSYSPETGYLYAQGMNSLLWLGTGDDPYDLTTNINGTRVVDYPAMTAVVAAIDPATDKVVWRKELPSYDDGGYKADGGALGTEGGLVFHQGGDGTLQAFDARTGETLWRFRTDFAAGDAPPMSYAIDGKQYVAFVAGTKVWAFALGGTLPQAGPIPAPLRGEVAGPIEDATEVETTSLEQGPGNGHRYRLNEYAFNPYRARVYVGAPVTFINNGSTPRTIVARDGSWTTGTLIPTAIATLKFDKPGSFIYCAKEYPWSCGEIIVVPARAAGSPGESAAAEQASLGKSDYATSCAACHGASLGGRDPAPALAGSGFAGRWAGRDALALFERIRTTMPQSAPESLDDDTYAAIVAYILTANDNPPPAPLDRQDMKGVAVTAGAAR